MTMQIYNDLILPESVIAAGVRGRQVRKNTRVQAHGGQVQVNIEWDQTLREFDIGFKPMLLDAWHDIEGLFERTRGGAYGFLMRDPKDFRDDGIGTLSSLGPADTFEMVKTYAALVSPYSSFRQIKRPYTDTYGGADILFFKNDIYVSSGVTYDRDTGVVIFTTAPDPEDVLTWVGGFYIPVHFKEDTIDWEMVRSGPDSGRLVAGPSCVLKEIRE